MSKVEPDGNGEFLRDPRCSGRFAVEANRRYGFRQGSIVKLELWTWLLDGEPMLVFEESPDEDWKPLPIYDQRVNVTRLGYAFSVSHPGTLLPQQPWAL